MGNRYNDVWNNVGGNYNNNIHAGEGSISQNPLFVDPGEGDFHLTENSPRIDTGDPNTIDPDGSRTDMGAFPFQDRVELEPVTAQPDSVSFGIISADSVTATVITLVNPNENEITVIVRLPEESVFSVPDTTVVMEGEGVAELTITFTPEGEVGEWGDSLRMISLSLIEVELLDTTLIILRPVGYTAMNITGAAEVCDYVDQKDVLPIDFEVINTFPNPFNSSAEILIRTAVSERG